jgi:hypothetical protein
VSPSRSITMSNLKEVPADVILQPWFLPQDSSRAVVKLLPPHYLTKMRDYFEAYGCMVCDRKSRMYHGNGMCQQCCMKIVQRLRRCVKRRARKNDREAASQSLDKLTINAQIARDLLSDLAPNVLKSSDNPVRELSGRRGRSS